MKLLLVALTLIGLSLTTSLAFAAKPFDSCACSANDGSCNASVGRTGGCLAFCPSNGCRAMCTDGGDNPELPMAYVGLHFNGSDSQAVSAELTRVSGRD